MYPKQKQFYLRKILVGAMVSIVFSCLVLLASASVALAAPGAPTLNSVSTGGVVSWTAPGSGDPPTHYRIYRSLNTITDANRYSATLVAASVTSSPYTDSTAIKGETYYWAVSAVSAGNAEGPVSNNISQTIAGTEDPHGSYAATGNLCKDCHSVHAATGTVKLYRKATQREVCYTCHDGTGSTNQNIQAQVNKTSNHPVGTTVRSTATLECIHCHSPHRVTTPRHTAPGNSASGVLTAVSGVEPNPWPTPNVQPRNIPAHPALGTTEGGGPIAGGVNLVRAGSYLYAVSGGSVRFWRYNPSNNAWERMADAPAAFANGAAMAYTGGDYIYVFQGGTTAFWKYQISTDTWNPGGAPAVALGNTAAGAALAYTGGDYIFAFQGGTVAFWAYSIANNNWTTFNPPDVSAATGVGAALAWDGGNYIFAFQGGTAAFWAYSIPNNDWNTTLNPPDTPSNQAVGAGGSLCYPGSGDYIYALRGGTQTTFWAYSKSNNNWATLDPADAPAAVGTNSGNRLAGDGGSYIYCLRGETNGEFWRYKMNTSWNDGQAAPSAYTVVNPVQKEYQLCLKCHSNYSSSPVGPQPGGQMNLAEAINPMTVSHHPIAGSAANRYCDSDTMESPWNQVNNDVSPLNQTHNVMYCSDCHGSDANDLPSETNTPTDPLGPHGSNQSKILRAPLTADADSATYLCIICHKKSVYVTNDATSRYGDHKLASHKVAQGCLTCHLGGSGVSGGKAASYKEYIHGSNLVMEIDATNRGPANAFLYGDGLSYVRQADLDCWTVTSGGPSGCAGKHAPRNYSAPAP